MFTYHVYNVYVIVVGWPEVAWHFNNLVLCDLHGSTFDDIADMTISWYELPNISCSYIGRSLSVIFGI